MELKGEIPTKYPKTPKLIEIEGGFPSKSKGGLL
jgi:hypothetical protein